MAPPICPLCTLPAGALVAGNDRAVAVRDIAPVAPLHTLVLPRLHIADYFDLDVAEREAIAGLLADCRRDILVRDPAVAGFNIAINLGAAAGQTVLHCHVHLLPRRPGDAAAAVLDGPRKQLLPHLPDQRS